MKTLKDKVAAITGAGSGIGRATATLLAKHGCNLSISDVNQEGLEQTAEQCRAFGVKVKTTRVDVSKREQVEAWAKDTVQELGGVHIVINNAGVALGATIEDTSYEDFEWLMGINFWGVVYGAKSFLPYLKAQGEGHIVNISSVFGLIAVPTQAAYNAAKFAVKGFSEALRQELEIEDCGVSVTTVHPGGIKTNIARNARMTPRDGWVHSASGKEFEKAFSTTPDQAAQDIVNAIVKNRRRQLIGTDAVAIDLLQRVFPVLYQKLLISGGRKRRQKLLSRQKVAGT